MRTFKTATMTLLAGTATIALLQPANALEAQAFVDRVAEVYQHMGYGLEFGAATLDGDTITVDGVVVSLAGMEGEPMTYDFDTTITFSGVTEGEDGSYFAESVTIPDVDAPIEAEPAGRITIADVAVDGFYLPPGDTVTALGAIQSMGALSTGPLSVERDGTPVFSYDSLTAANTFNPEQGSADLIDLSSEFVLAGVDLDLTSVGEEDPAAAATIEQLGLTNVTGNITQTFSWTMADGHMVMDQFLLDFDDVGALNVTADITGFTPDVLDQIYAMQAEMMAAGEELTEEQSQAQMMSGMALMQGVSVVSTGVRFEDAGITARVLDTLATQNGTDAATFVEGLKSGLPAIVGQAGIPALIEAVVPPVSAFLDDPQSLEARIQPAQPTSLLVLMAGAANPAGLIQTLGLAVTANEAAAE